MSVLLDGLLLLLIGMNMVSGWRRGFIKVFSGLLALAVATVVASFLGNPIASAIAPNTALDPTLVQLLCAIALFAVTYGLMAFMLRSLDLVAKIPLVKHLNKVVGLGVGALCGLLWAVFAVGVLQTLAKLGWLPFLTPAVLEKTWLISWVSGLLPTIGFVNPVVITR